MKHLVLLANMILISFKLTSQVELSKKIQNPGENKGTGRMNTEQYISKSFSSQLNSAPIKAEEVYVSNKNSYIPYEEIRVKRPPISSLEIDLTHRKNITFELTWNKTEMSSLNTILRTSDGKFLKDEKKSHKDVIVKKSEKENIVSEIVNIGKIKKGIFSLYIKLDKPKNSIKNANVSLIIKGKERKKIFSFTLDNYFPQYWYLGLFDYDESKLLATAGEFMNLEEIDDHVNRYLREKKKKKIEKYINSKKSPINRVHGSLAKSKQKLCPSEKQVVMRWLKNLLANMLQKSKNLKSFVDKGFGPENSFLQKSEQNILPKKFIPKKVKRLLLIFPLRRIIIIRGKRLINRIKSLPPWKKRIFIRMMRHIIISTIRANRRRRMKLRIILRIRNILKKLKQAKLKNKKN